LGKLSQVNFRLMAELNISVSRPTKLHSRFTNNINELENSNLKKLKLGSKSFM